MIIKIQREEKEILDHQGIKREFYKYYAKLYAKQNISKEEVQHYIEELQNVEVTEELRKDLNERISKEEIIRAIMDTKSGKAPGTDGITAKFYKALKYEVVDMLEVLFNEIPAKGFIPETWTQANITLIPKETQDLTDVKNYRPISLLKTTTTKSLQRFGQGD